MNGFAVCVPYGEGAGYEFEDEGLPYYEAPADDDPDEAFQGRRFGREPFMRLSTGLLPNRQRHGRQW